MIQSTNTTQRSDEKPQTTQTTSKKEKSHSYPIRAECPKVIEGQAELKNFSLLMNNKIDSLCNLIMRWYGGGYGSVEGEDLAQKKDMQAFAEVALQNLPAKFLVRVFTHLERGDNSLLQSARGLISGDTRKSKSEGPLEKAVIAGDTKKIEAYRSYLKIVDLVSRGELKPLSFLNSWRENLVSKWTDIIINDAAEYLKHHIKLLDLHEKKEQERLDALDKFTKSKRGENYLEFRKNHTEAGIPRNRQERFKILNTKEAINWDKPKKERELVVTKDVKNLLEKNKSLVDLISADLEYARLIKSNTPPTWTPVAEENKRWVFIPMEMFSGKLLNNGEISLNIKLPQLDGSNEVLENVAIRLAPTTNLKHAALNQNLQSDKKTRWNLNWPDHMTNGQVPIVFKGMRFELSGSNRNSAISRISYEVQSEPQSNRISDLYESAKKKETPILKEGDLLCTFSLEVVTKGQKNNSTRVGWLNTYGFTANGKVLLDKRPIHSVDQLKHQERPLRKGQKTFWGAEPSAKSKLSRRHAYGQTEQGSFPQIYKKASELKHAVRILRLLKDPERRDEALDWVNGRLKHPKDQYEQRRLISLKETLENGEAPNRNQLRPYKAKIQVLRSSLREVKENFRNRVAKVVVKNLHAARTGRLSEKISDYHQAYGQKNSETIFVTEYQKGKGAGPYKKRVQNSMLSVLGVSEIYGLIEEKSLVTRRPIPVFTIIPTNLRKLCPDGHKNVTNPEKGMFHCASDGCNKSMLAVELAALNLAELFLNPDKYLKN